MSTAADIDVPASWRYATRDDGPRLVEIFSSVSMESDLHLTVDRDPDFFALYDVQQEVEALVPVLLEGGKIEGMGALMAREGYLFGERRRVGYLGDLRFTRQIRGADVLNKLYPPIIEDCAEKLGTDVWYTVIIRSNKAAVKALEHRHPDFPDKPWYARHKDFSIHNIQFTTKKKPRKTRYAVSRATMGDLAEIAEFLDADHRQRPFGYVFTQDLLRQRVERWPGLSAESFYLARDPHGALRGVTAVWDPDAIKRFRVLGYHGSMRVIKVAWNLVSRFTGFTPVPDVGGIFRCFYLTHVSVQPEDPEVMGALLDRIYADHRGKGFHFFSACVYKGDPLAPAYERFYTTGLPARLYVVSPPGSPFNTLDLGPHRPGFEMGLV